MRIQLLPPFVACQIAAGEVILNPAAVIKELLENAMDAKATQINIEIEQGGLNRIKVSDNGIGIVADDLALAIAPHATSKITCLEDLFSISSMGFRGEALASIAAVSRITISSKPLEQSEALQLIQNEEGLSMAVCARTQGTTVDVRDIFFNTPVRKKFLKNTRLEWQAIESLVKRFALSMPGIAISLSHNDKKSLNLAQSSSHEGDIDRIAKIFGNSFLAEASYIEVEYGECRLKGWVSQASYQRSQTDQQWFYVNRRMVKDKLLMHAVRQAYQDLLYPGRHPAYLLYLTMPPNEVDVNIHPTKQELRFQQPRLIHDFISSQVKQVLSCTSNRASALPEQSTIFTMAKNGHYVAEKSPFSFRLSSKPNPSKPNPSKYYSATQNTAETNQNNYLGLNDRYALVLLQEEPYLIDMICLYHQWLKTCLAKPCFSFEKRLLGVPVTQRLTHLNLTTFDYYQTQLESMGITLSSIAENTILIRSLPRQLPWLDSKSFLSAIFKEEKLNPVKIMELLLQHQIFNPQYASLEEQEILQAFMQSKEATQRENWQKHLSKTLCQDLFYA